MNIDEEIEQTSSTRKSRQISIVHNVYLAYV